MGEVALTVNGRVYRMGCGDGEEEHVAELAVRFDAAIDQLRSGLGELGDPKLTVMAGIWMTDKLDETERRLARAEQDLRDLKDLRTNTAMRIEGMEANFAEILEETAARIERIAERLSGDADIPDGASG